MPPKGTRRKGTVMNRQTGLDKIKEVDQTDIFDAMSSEKESFNHIIQRLEETLPEYSDILLKTFLTFYLKVCGLSDFVAELEDIKEMSQFDLSTLIQKIEKLQIKHDSRQIVCEETAKKIIDKVKENEPFQTNVEKFFSTLFSTKSDLPFECVGFFDQSIRWLEDLMRSRVRIVRIACIELVQYLLDACFNMINSISFDDERTRTQEDQHKSLIRFVDGIRLHILTYTLKDVHLPLQKRTIHLLFSYSQTIPLHVNTAAYHEFIGNLFFNDKLECREEAMKCFGQLLHQASQSKSPDSIDLILQITASQQEKILSLVFEFSNEQTQVDSLKVLKFLPQLSKNPFKLIKNSLKTKLTKTLFRSNDRVKYEVLLFLLEIDEEFNEILKVYKITYPQGRDSNSLSRLCQLCLKYKPNNLSIPLAAQKFFSPFFILHRGTQNPDNYLSLILEHENKHSEHLDGYLEVVVYFYQECTKLSRFYEANSNLYCWLTFEEDQLDQICSIYNVFSQTFFKHLKSLQLQCQQTNSGLIAYLSLISFLNLSILSDPSSSEVLDHLIRNLRIIFEKSEDYQVLALCSLIFKSLHLIQLPSNGASLLQDSIREIQSAIQHFISKEGFTPLNQHKMMCLVQYTHVLITELLSGQQIQELRAQASSQEKQEKLIELFGYAVISGFKTCLKTELKTLQSNSKSLQDYLEEFEFVKQLFFEDAFKQLEIFSSLSTYLHIITVLGFLNNNNLGDGTKQFCHHSTTEHQARLLFKTLYENVLTKFEPPKGEISDESENQELLNRPLLETKITELNEQQWNSLQETLLLFKISTKSIDMHFGVRVLHFLIEKSLTNKQKDNRGIIQGIIQDILNSLYQLEFQDYNKNNLVYWKVLLDIARYNARVSDALLQLEGNKGFYSDFARFVTENYIVKNANMRKITPQMKREKFIMFCAECIFNGFSKISEMESLLLLQFLFSKSVKLQAKLQVEKVVLKKICVFFEARKIELEKKLNSLEDDEQLLFQRIVPPISAMFRELVQETLQIIQSGISNVDIQKAMDSEAKVQPQEDEEPQSNQDRLRDEVVANIEEDNSQQHTSNIHEMKPITPVKSESDEQGPIQKRFKKIKK